MRRAMALLAMMLVAGDASAEMVIEVDHAKVRVADVVPNAQGEVAKVDLGPAPPPGASRLVVRDEIAAAVHRAGLSTSALRIPAVVRIVRPARRIDAVTLSTLAAPEVKKQLPRGVTLTKIEASQGATVSPAATVRTGTIPAPPRHKGPFQTTTTIEIGSDGTIEVRVPASITLEVSEEAARPDVARGARVDVVVEHRGVRVSAIGTASLDANVGDVIPVLLAPTGRTVRARIVARDTARLETSP